MIFFSLFYVKYLKEYLIEQVIQNYYVIPRGSSLVGWAKCVSVLNSLVLCSIAMDKKNYFVIKYI